MSAHNRNAPCPCGSGKKYKKCCLGKAATETDASGKAVKSDSHNFNTTNVVRPASLLMRGVALHQAGKLDEAESVYRELLANNSDDSDALHYLGLIALQRYRYSDAVGLIESAITLNPGVPAFHCNLGNAYRGLGQPDSAISSYLEAVRLDPEFQAAHNNLGNAFKDQGKMDEADASYRKALSLRPDFAKAHSNLLLTMQYSLKYSPSEIFAEHLRFAEQFETPLKPLWPAHKNARNPDKRLRIGYVSGDFRNHAVAYFIEPILANHDKSRFEIFCYYNHTQHDCITNRIAAAADHWVPCKELSDEQLAERIRSDGIDILVDLSGHTAHNRLLAFARKPAPIQVMWIGYPGTSGLAAMDYRLTDDYMDPVGMTERYHTETLLRLPSSAAFQPSPESPPVNTLPALTSGRFTLACLNNLAKINQDVIRLWARILIALPHARLMLGNATDVQTRQRLTGMFAREGIAAERLVLHPTMPLSDYLALHHQIDLALDSFPFNGGTTTFHSLWMGVPAITLAGSSTAARTGVAIMARAGMECVARSADEYVERTLEFAGNLPRLNQIRQSLRERMNAQSGADPVHLTRSLEDAFRNIWKKWCNG